MDCGLGLRKLQGLFSKLTPEGVSVTGGRRIRKERPETNPREREGDVGGEERQPWRLSIAGGMEVTGAHSQRPTATVRKSGGTGRKLGRRGTRPGHHNGRRRKPRRRAPWSAAKARGRSRIGPQTATKYQIENTEGRRGVRRSSPRLQTETNATRGRRFARR